jgi:hypothetical protein
MLRLTNEGARLNQNYDTLVVLFDHPQPFALLEQRRTSTRDGQLLDPDPHDQAPNWQEQR